MTLALTSYRTGWDAWHAAREDELRTPHGWLSLTALHWLTAEPSAVDGLPGRWSATPDGVVVTAAATDDLVVRTVSAPSRLDGPVRVDGTVVLRPVDGRPGTLIECDGLVVEVARRTDAHVLRVRDPQAVTRTAFTGVPTFPVDETWLVDATFAPYAQPRTITVGAVVEGLEHFPTAVGVVTFALDARPQELVALAGRDGVGLVLHFRDATSGVSTYSGGRVLRTDEPGADGRLVLDLNRVVNLPCAFTDHATCPLPPAGNVVTTAVEAGERLPLRPDRP